MHGAARRHLVASLNKERETIAAASAAHDSFPPAEVWAGMSFGQRKRWRKTHLQKGGKSD